MSSQRKGETREEYLSRARERNAAYRRSPEFKAKDAKRKASQEYKDSIKPYYRERMRALRADPEYRAKQREWAARRWDAARAAVQGTGVPVTHVLQDPILFRERAAAGQRRRRAEIPGYREKLNARTQEWRERKKKDADYIATRAAKQRARYASDPEYRERLAEQARKRRSDPDIAAKKREYKREWMRARRAAAKAARENPTP